MKQVPSPKVVCALNMCRVQWDWRAALGPAQQERGAEDSCRERQTPRPRRGFRMYKAAALLPPAVLGRVGLFMEQLKVPIRRLWSESEITQQPRKS